MIHVRPSFLSHTFSWPSRNLVLIVELVPLSSQRTIIKCHAFSGSLMPRDMDLIKDDVLANVRELELDYVRLKDSGET